jgi:hypothetical protein
MLYLVCSDFLKEYDLFFQINLVRWQMLYSDSYDDNESVENNYDTLRTLCKKLAAMKKSNSKNYSIKLMKEYPEKSKLDRASKAKRLSIRKTSVNLSP